MEAKHTPGPWQVAGHTFQHTLTCWTRPVHTTAPGVGQRAAGRTKEEADANAALIAAAPDLLAACAELLVYIQMLKDHITYLDGPGCYIPTGGGREEQAHALVESAPRREPQ